MLQDRIKEKMYQTFEDNLPNSLYMDHYTLAEQFDGTPKMWRDFLKDPENQRFIESELAAITEAAARAALQKLSSGTANSNDISAIKQLLDKSKMLQQNQNSQERIILTFIPKKEGNHA
jgi:hypothetical protein